MGSFDLPAMGIPVRMGHFDGMMRIVMQCLFGCMVRCRSHCRIPRCQETEKQAHTQND
jgi:hypothetical protein